MKVDDAQACGLSFHNINVHHSTFKRCFCVDQEFPGAWFHSNVEGTISGTEKSGISTIDSTDKMSPVCGVNTAGNCTVFHDFKCVQSCNGNNQSNKCCQSILHSIRVFWVKNLSNGKQSLEWLISSTEALRVTAKGITES